jgi:hypothetical protein
MKMTCIVKEFKINNPTSNQIDLEKNVVPNNLELHIIIPSYMNKDKEYLKFIKKMINLTKTEYEIDVN